MSDVTISGAELPNYTYTGSVHSLRVYCPEGFTASDLSIIPGGMPGSGQWYQSVTGTVSGASISYQNFTLKATTNGPNTNTARYIFVITVDGVEKEWFTVDGVNEFKVPPTPDTTTLGALAIHNRGRVRNLNRDEFYTKDQVNALIDEIWALLR